MRSIYNSGEYSYWAKIDIQIIVIVLVISINISNIKVGQL